MAIPRGPDELTLMSLMAQFSTEETAREYMEARRWPYGPVCPHCGNADGARIARVQPNPAAKIRPGLYRCNECIKQFTVTVGTIFEDSHIPLNKWLIAFYLLSSSKTQISALQVQRQLEIGSYRSAWHMCHRIRFAMTDSGGGPLLTGTVEVDETYFGGVRHGQGRGTTGKTPVISLLERGGRVHSQVVESANKETAGLMLAKSVDKSAVINSDETRIYDEAASYFQAHDKVNHSKEEYGRYDKGTGRHATTNAVEGFFGNTKRSIDGTHHHVSKKHLGRYMGELDFKFNERAVSDGARTAKAIDGAPGKRLMLRTLIGPKRAKRTKVPAEPGTGRKDVG